MVMENSRNPPVSIMMKYSVSKWYAYLCNVLVGQTELTAFKSSCQVSFATFRKSNVLTRLSGLTDNLTHELNNS